VYEEERELVVMLLVDFSRSQNFGSTRQMKNEIATEICALLAFSAIKNNDKVGLILFTDEIEKFIPPKKGRSHILRIIRELLSFEPKGKGTNIKAALEYFNRVIKKRCIAFLISDFIDDGYEKPLRIVGRKHDLIALNMYDPREKELPKVGLVKFKDAETGEEIWVNTGDVNVREEFGLYWRTIREKRERLFITSNVDAIDVRIDEPYINPLVNFFRQRERRL
jgi:uncharacterized protein (DUF58 family)